MIRFVVAASVVVLAAAACGPECEHINDCDVGETCTIDGTCVDLCPASGTGTIRGKVVTPDGRTPVIGATVVLTTDGGRETTSAYDGTFTFEEVPGGAHEIAASKGRFFGNPSFDVCDAKEIEIIVPLAPPPHSLAVVPGDFDSVEAVLEGMGLQVGYHFDMIDPGTLRNPSALDGVEYLFFNCTTQTLASDTALQQNVAAWVAAGGRMYASDWAFEFVDAIFPGRVTFPADPRVGVEGEIGARVVDTELVSYLGKSNVRLDYNLGDWVVPSAAEGTIVVEGDYRVRTAEGTAAESGPLLVQFPEGVGRVTYTTFHNEAQTTADMDAILVFLVFRL